MILAKQARKFEIRDALYKSKESRPVDEYKDVSLGSGIMVGASLGESDMVNQRDKMKQTKNRKR